MVSESITRRDFVRTAAAAGAGLVLASGNRLFSQASPANNRINVALVGFGAQGRVLQESLLKINGIQLVAVCDIWDYARTYAERYLKKAGVEVRTYRDHEELLATEKDLQAVVVATPDFWHAPVTNACLRAGKDVYCEKMMSNTIEGARSMVKTMKETGKLLQIGHQRRSNPRYLFALNRLLREAKICGRLTAAQAQWNRAATPDFGWPKKSAMDQAKLAKYGFADMHQFRNWRWFKNLGGGPLSDLGAHQIDIFNWWFGVKPTAVLATGGVDYYKNHEWCDNVMVIYEYPLPEGMARAFYQVQTTTSAGGGYFEYFMGDEGSLKMSENPKLTTIYREARAPSWDEWIGKNYIRAQGLPPKTDSDDNTQVDVRETAALASFDLPVSFNKAIHQPHLENFFNAIRKTAKLNCPADEAFSSEYIIHKANEAITARRTLDLNAAEMEAT
ncbi:MAG: Gfo/Idh/MocA family oxidoreductase [Verrucomicrobiae bacterium]